ncbi:MAG: cupin domain-containing protein [Thermoplasmata archaeon]|nr:MAG: cupin domain-containing protein [Thermoplasmata archaeon]
MKRKNIEDVPEEEVTIEGVKKTRIQWIWTKADGAPNFAMRRFIMEPGGEIPLHNHPWEHEIYVLSGEGEVYTDKERIIAQPGDALFVPPDEPHGYVNTGDEPFIFLCMIPKPEKG